MYDNIVRTKHTNGYKLSFNLFFKFDFTPNDQLVSHVFVYERNDKHLSLLVVFFQLNLLLVCQKVKISSSTSNPIYYHGH